MVRLALDDLSYAKQPDKTLHAPNSRCSINSFPTLIYILTPTTEVTFDGDQMNHQLPSSTVR